MSSAEYIKIAQGLPPRLLRFFARFPPVTASSNPYGSLTDARTGIRRTSEPVSVAPTTSSTDPNASQIETSVNQSASSTLANPFLPTRHAVTQRIHDPQFSLRRQADLIKLARGYGIEECLPPSSKSPTVRDHKRLTSGLRVRGTGIGQSVKGKRWERTLPARQAVRYAAMLRMPKIIQAWKRVCLPFAQRSTDVIDWSWTRMEEVA